MSISNLDDPPRYGQITHIALLVKNPEKAAEWYSDVLGVEVVVSGPTGCFLSLGHRHHDIALIAARNDHVPWSVGLHHVAIAIEGGPEELRRLYDRLISKNVVVDKIADHAIGWGVYFFDPDGNRLEFFCDRPDVAPERWKATFQEAGAPTIAIHRDQIG